MALDHIPELSEKYAEVFASVGKHTEGWRQDVCKILTDEKVQWTTEEVDTYICDVMTGAFGALAQSFKENAPIPTIADAMRHTINDVILDSDPEVLVHDFKSSRGA